ncbi:fimbrial protein [Providencia rettgeri]|uniref:fimbrial protein n=1 Tax=Providencia rettgeri TaxID=587 RepID=UPI0020B6E2AA|nr:fimbrial protein [Providencia rettgeri]
MKIKFLYTLLVFSTFSYSASLTVGFNGNLISTPFECILNNSQKSMVHFGDILLSRIDGVNYKHTLTFELTCTNLAMNNLALSIQGDPSNFNNGILKTSNPKLGLSFYINGIKQDINKKINFNYLELPSLEVSPVKNTNSSFDDTDGGDFTALATLNVDYQ